MESQLLLQHYFETYLRNIRGLSETSIKHYLDALQWISKHLTRNNLISDSIFTVTQPKELDDLKNILSFDPEFIELDKRGHQMYSAGMKNYIRFINATDFDHIGDKVKLMDEPVQVPAVKTTEHDTWQRSAIIRKQVLMAEDYKCEIDNTHTTFIAESTSHPYAEGHHIIALKKQSRIPNSLDIYANIVCLCPTCHRFLHYGRKDEKTPVVNRIYAERADRFAKCGIYLSQQEFQELVL